MNFPRVRPLGARTPWSAPQTIEAVPETRTIRPAIASGAIVQARPAAAVREAHRYAQINGSSIFNLTQDSQLITPAPQNFRNLLMIRNIGAGVINIEFGRDATPQATVQLQPNQIILFDTVVPQDDVYGICPGGLSAVSISFSNLNFLEPIE